MKAWALEALETEQGKLETEGSSGSHHRVKDGVKVHRHFGSLGLDSPSSSMTDLSTNYTSLKQT